MKSTSPDKISTFLFSREEGVYLIHIPRNTLADNIRLNPGTLSVQEMRNNKLHVVWTQHDGWWDVELNALQGESPE